MDGGEGEGRAACLIARDRRRGWLEATLRPRVFLLSLHPAS